MVKIGVVRYGLIPLAGLLVAVLVARWAARAAWPLGRGVSFRPRVWVCALGVLGVLTFGGLVVARHLTWHSFVHDLGSYDQKVWRVSTRQDGWEMLRQTWRGGEPSPCGRVRYWGICHFQPLHLIPALLYKVWASPLLLLWLQVLAVMAGMIPLYALARDRLGEPTAVGICAVFLLFPAVQYNALLDFRPDFVAIPLLLWAFLLAERGRFLAALAVAVAPGLMKETLLVTFAFFGLFVWLRHGRRALGVGAFAGGFVAFYLVAFHLLSGPESSEAGFLIERYFRNDVLATMLRWDKLIYLGAVFGPLAGLPLLSPLPLLPALPTLGTSLLSSDVTHASIHSQYSASAVGPLFVALLEGVSRLRSRRRGWAHPVPLVSGLVTLGVFMTLALGPTPLSLNLWVRSWGGHWHSTQYLPDRQEALNRAEALIPTDPDVVVVTQNDVNSPRLAHRHAYYAFPNQLEEADYVVLDTRRLPFIYWTPEPERYRELVQGLRANPDWGVIFEEDGVLVFRRERG